MLENFPHCLWFSATQRFAQSWRIKEASGPQFLLASTLGSPGPRVPLKMASSCPSVHTRARESAEGPNARSPGKVGSLPHWMFYHLSMPGVHGESSEIHPLWGDRCLYPPSPHFCHCPEWQLSLSGKNPANENQTSAGILHHGVPGLEFRLSALRRCELGQIT